MATASPAGTAIPMCARGLHLLTPDNRWKGTDRCILCKRVNDKVLYETKRAAATGAPWTPAQTEARQTELLTASVSGTALKAAASAKVGAAVRRSPASAPAAAGAAVSAFAARAEGEVITAEPDLDEITATSDRGYRTRALAGMPDIDALRKARDAKLPVMLYGPPGAGKSDLVRSAFPDVITLNGDGDTLVDDFVGGWTPTDQADAYVWIDGPLIRAMRLGLPFFIDDATLISPKVLAIVYPVMDGRGWVQVKGHPVQQDDGTWGPDLVQAAEGFFILGGHNPGVHGAILTEALASRFSIHVHVATSYNIARSMDIDPRAIKIAENMVTQFAAGEVGWAPQMRELLAYQDVAAIWGTTAAVSNLVGVCPQEDRPALITHAKSVFGESVTHLALGEGMERKAIKGTEEPA